MSADTTTMTIAPNEAAAALRDATKAAREAFAPLMIADPALPELRDVLEATGGALTEMGYVLGALVLKLEKCPQIGRDHDAERAALFAGARLREAIALTEDAAKAMR